MHIAQLNIGRARYPLDDPRMAGFMNALAAINAIADRSPGFVWRMADEGGAGATDIKYTDDPQQIANMSVWETAEALEHFVWNTAHKKIYAQKHAWFEPPAAGALESATALLARLGLVDRSSALTPLGRQVMDLPLPPRLARMLLAAGGAPEMAAACALLSERSFVPARRSATTCDLLSAIDHPRSLPPHVRRVADALVTSARAVSGRLSGSERRAGRLSSIVSNGS